MATTVIVSRPAVRINTFQRPEIIVSAQSPTMKTCICCAETKPPSEFLFSRYYADKLTPRCRQCVFGAALRLRAERTQRDQQPQQQTGG